MILNMQFHFHVWTLRPLDRTQNRTFCKVDVTLSHAHAQKGSQTFLLPLIALSSNYPAYFQRKTFHPLPKAGEKSFSLFLKGKLSLKIYTPYHIFDRRVSIVLKRHGCAETLVQQGCTQRRNKWRFPPSLDPAEEHAKGKYTAMYTNIFIKNILI